MRSEKLPEIEISNRINPQRNGFLQNFIILGSNRYWKDIELPETDRNIDPFHAILYFNNEDLCITSLSTQRNVCYKIPPNIKFELREGMKLKFAFSSTFVVTKVKQNGTQPSVVISYEDPIKRPIEITNPFVTVGRRYYKDGGSWYLPKETGACSNHATIEYDPLSSSWGLTDNESINGTFIYLTGKEPHTQKSILIDSNSLYRGAEFHLGPYQFDVDIDVQ